VISIVRKPGGISQSKLKEVIHSDFENYTDVSMYFKEIDVAYFCIGVYTGTVPDSEFKRITVDYTVHFADVLMEKSPHATLCFLSGGGADLKEKSMISFARYKGMAENYLIHKSFNRLYIFRPNYIYPVEKREEPNLFYKVYRMLYPLIRLLGKRFSIKSTELASAMFRTGLNGADKMILENQDILLLA
jgi:hypothetical protein